jgi:Bacteriophage tail sheath protein
VAPPVPSDPARADIACFVGFTACRTTASAQRARLVRVLQELGWDPPEGTPPFPASDRVLPANVRPSGTSPLAFPRWVEGLGWTPRPNATAAIDLFRRAASGLLGEALVDWWSEATWLAPFSNRSAADLLELVDVPAPVNTWDAFDSLFAWNERPTGDGRNADTHLGAAVRRFFLHGGRKCYVIRIGNPWPILADPSARAGLLSRVLETLPEPTPVDRSTWRGIGHLFGLPDVSFLSVPDLPELFAANIRQASVDTAAPIEERFIECGTETVAPSSRSLRSFPAPRCDANGFRNWAALVKQVGSLLDRRCREMQFVAAVPLAADDPLERARDAQRDAAGSIQTAFVQLVYPWLRTRESGLLPGAVEPPDAMLTGLLANNALTSGTWRSVARLPVAGVIDLEPELSAAELDAELPYQEGDGTLRLPRTLQERISIFHDTASGVQLLSDVTTDDDESYRPANVNRLVAAIVRAARLAGEDATFANNGEALWRRLQTTLEELLLDLWGDGALVGESASEAFDVRCDRSTMTQADLDAGRVIARVQFTAAAPIAQITVVFSMDEGGQVTLVTAQAPEAAPIV